MQAKLNMSRCIDLLGLKTAHQVLLEVVEDWTYEGSEGSSDISGQLVFAKTFTLVL